MVHIAHTHWIGNCPIKIRFLMVLIMLLFGSTQRYFVLKNAVKLIIHHSSKLLCYTSHIQFIRTLYCDIIVAECFLCYALRDIITGAHKHHLPWTKQEFQNMSFVIPTSSPWVIGGIESFPPSQRIPEFRARNRIYIQKKLYF